MFARISSLTSDVFQLLRHGSDAKQAGRDKRLEALVANSSDIVAILDSDAVVQFVSNSVTTILGYQPVDIIEHSALEFADPLDAQRARAAIQKLTQTVNATDTLEFKFQHADGTWRDIETTCQNLLEDPTVRGIIVNARDVTERKQTRLALQASEVRFRAITEDTKDITLILDKDGAYQYVSPSVAKITGRTCEDLIGTSSFDFVHAADVGLYQYVLRQAIQQPGETLTLPLIRGEFEGEEAIYYEVQMTSLIDTPGVEGVVVNTRDVTDRQLAENELVKSEQRTRLALSAANAGSWWLEFGAGAAYWSDECYQLMGYDPLKFEPSFENWKGLINPEDWQRIKPQVVSILISKDNLDSDFDLEYRITRPDGESRWINLLGRITQDGNGRPESMYGLLIDITERKEVAATLAQVSAEQVIALESANISINQSIGRLITRVDSAFEKMFGWNLENFTDGFDAGKIYADPEEFKRVEQEAYPILAEGEIYETEILAKRKNGTTFWCRLVSKATDPVNAPEQVTWLSEDISEAKQAEAALRDAEERARLALWAAKAGAWFWEPANGKVIWSDEHYKLLNYDKETDEASFYHWLARVHPDDRDWVLGELDQVLLDRAGIEIEYRVVLPDDTIRWMQMIGRITTDNSESEYSIYGLLIDITERKMIEQELHHSQKMEAIGQLTGGVAHDFNNLLGIILASVELVGEYLDETANPKEINLLQKAIKAVARGENLTRRLLAFSRKQTLRPEIVDVNELVVHTAAMLRRTVPESIEIQTQLDASLSKTEVDQSQLEDALLNFAINARDAMPEGGRLTIKTKNEFHTAKTHAEFPSAAGNFVRVSVTDTGTGIIPEVLEHVFDPFFTTKEVGQGSGLGLSMVYGFAKQSNGHVTIHSEEGIGTTVNLCLPGKIGPASKEIADISSELPKGNGEVILVVEDDPSVREVTVDLLKSLRYEVIEAASGQEGMSILATAKSIDLMLTDVILPGGMNGVELRKNAEELRPQLSAILMSGYTDLPDGALPDDAILLNKPISRNELAHSIRAALHSLASHG